MIKGLADAVPSAEFPYGEAVGTGIGVLVIGRQAASRMPTILAVVIDAGAGRGDEFAARAGLDNRIDGTVFFAHWNCSLCSNARHRARKPDGRKKGGSDLFFAA
jgi:hypothetical protein